MERLDIYYFMLMIFLSWNPVLEMLGGRKILVSIVDIGTLSYLWVLGRANRNMQQ